MLSTARNSRGKRPISGIHVLLAALDDQGPRRVGGENVGAGIGRRAEHAHGVIMAEQHEFDRLVGDLLHPLDHLARHHRRRLGVDHHHAVVADDDPGIGIAFGGEGVEVGPDGVEADRLLGHICGRGEIGAHRGSFGASPRASCSGGPCAQLRNSTVPFKAATARDGPRRRRCAPSQLRPCSAQLRRSNCVRRRAFG